ncbi:tyrosine-type recombinase/integrase [Isosphaeraceae bacterium EP7]
MIVLNPAASVKGIKETVMEGKSPEIIIDQAHTLLASIKTGNVVGLRDRAILATLVYTACRAGAIAKLKMSDFQHHGGQYVFRFQEKGGKSREIPVRHDLEGFIIAHVESAGVATEAKYRWLLRAGNGKTKRLGDEPMSSKTICDLVKRRLMDARLPSRLSPASFRVTAIADLLTQGVPLEDVQYLAGHAEPQMTGLYDRRQKKVTRSIVERISI